jgi:excisionase family DNA binding protein
MLRSEEPVSGGCGVFYPSTRESPPDVAQNLMRLKQYAETRPISVMTLRRAIAEGKIGAFRLGKKIILIDANEVDAVLIRPIPTGGGDATK